MISGNLCARILEKGIKKGCHNRGFRNDKRNIKFDIYYMINEKTIERGS